MCAAAAPAQSRWPSARCRAPSVRVAMRRSTRALAAMALLLCACAPPPSSPAPTPDAAHTNSTSCTLLAEHSLKRSSLEWRGVSVGGRAARVLLVWGSEPARAAAALLRALLQHVRRYRAVHLRRAPHRTADLARAAPHRPTGDYFSLIIGVSTAWEPEQTPPWRPRNNEEPGLAGPRLREFGASSVPARRRLFARLTSRARQRPECLQHQRWSFYANKSALVLCDFANAATHQGSEFAAEVLVVGNSNATLRRLKERAEAAATPLDPHFVNRAEFMRSLRTNNHSFLFVDYDMWKDAPDVTVVEPPPCVTYDFDCKQDLDSSIAMRVADVSILQTYAPELFRFVHDFNPSPKTLRQILERQASGVDIEEAGCEWVLENKSYVISDNDTRKYDLPYYTVYICYCDEDPDYHSLKEIARIVREEVRRNQTVPAGWNVTLIQNPLNCSDHDEITNTLRDLKDSDIVYRLLGVVSLLVDDVAAMASSAAESQVPLMLADVVPDEGADADTTWRVAGRPRHVARALQHFVREAGWSRLAVLSSRTKLAANYYEALEDQTEIYLRNFEIPVHLTEQQAQEVLQALRSTNARIVFVNADSQAALKILSAGAASRMGYKDGYVWILREWRQNIVVNNTKHFTVSFWTRGLVDIPAVDGWKELQDKLSTHQPWPPRAVSLANALLTLSIGFRDVFQRYPIMRQDIHNAQMMKSLTESVNEAPVTGVNQLLRYKERSIEETFVFVDLWCDGEFKQRLATWRVNVTSGAVRGKSHSRANFSRPAGLPSDDGRSRCFIQTGDKYYPTCRDTECGCALLLLALAGAGAVLARRALLRRLTRARREELIEVIARRRHVAAALAAYLVPRAALQLREELGAGRFGSVRLARLRTARRAPCYIAAKALRDNAAPAEESEFLREACTIASLDHKHIVRLVGVCISDGPPLVLMELAFFGDLLGYMRARRHLVEDEGSDAPAASGEAEHVSAEALTRLAREAAEALQYLGVRGVVHRDLRAANCLVDVRRSLKLADFGMARDTVAGADGAPEYACRRRGLFPVLWMAPESLAHGVFSAASDVWALGVLVLELVTLGVRPYGSMSPLRVLEYVAAGGSPPLPLDATPQTRGLVRLCWARAAERRPSAAEVAAYLAARPRALRPALLSEPADADSGFGVSPSTELLPPDSTTHSLDQLEDLAASH